MGLLRVALALSAVGLLTACGPGSSVVMEPAAPVATAPAGSAGSGGSGGSGGAGGQGANTDDSAESSSEIDPTLARCIARFDDIPAIGSEDPRWKAWYHTGSQDLVDASMVDTTKLAKHMSAVADRQQPGHPKGPAATVRVAPACFPAAALIKARKQIEDEIFHNPDVHNPSTSGLRLDSRLPVGLGNADRAEGRRLEGRYGPMIKVTYSDDRGYPL